MGIVYDFDDLGRPIVADMVRDEDGRLVNMRCSEGSAGWLVPELVTEYTRKCLAVVGKAERDIRRLARHSRFMGLHIDYAAAAESAMHNSRVKVLKRELPPLSDEARRVVHIINQYPRLKCRTERTKRILAELLAGLAKREQRRIPRGLRAELAKKYGVTPRTISILLNRTRKLPYFKDLIKKAREVIE